MAFKKHESADEYPENHSSKTERKQEKAPFYTKYEKEPVRNTRQQSKLVAVFSRNDPKLLRSSEVELKQGETAKFHRDWENGYINPNDVKSVLVKISAPSDTTPPADLYERLKTFPRLNQIQAIISVAISPAMYDENKFDHEAFANRTEVGPESYAKFIQLYEEPATLESKMRILFKRIETNNGVEKRQDYEKSLRVLMGLTWGKRLEYWDQFKFLVENDTRPSSYKNRQDKVDDTEKDAPPAEKPHSKERSENVPIITNEGIVRKAVTSINGDSSGSEKRLADSKNSERLVPILEMLQSTHKVSFILENNTEFHLFSTPEKPDISDQEALEVINNLSKHMLETDPSTSNVSKFKLRMLFVCLPKSGIENQAAFDTKNTLHRVLLDKINDNNYFQQLIEKAKQ